MFPLHPVFLPCPVWALNIHIQLCRYFKLTKNQIINSLVWWHLTEHPSDQHELWIVRKHVGQPQVGNKCHLYKGLPVWVHSTPQKKLQKRSSSQSWVSRKNLKQLSQRATFLVLITRFPVVAFKTRRGWVTMKPENKDRQNKTETLL